MDGINKKDSNIFFIGFMGTGKTTISSYISNLFNREEIDTDKYIESIEKRTINQIFDEYGEEYFRNCETNVLKKLNKKTNIIVSCGGGIILRDENIKLMKEQGKIILLTASPEIIYERIKQNKERPILNDNMNIDFISNLMKNREEKYRKAANVIISTDNKSVEEISNEIVKKLNI